MNYKTLLIKIKYLIDKTFIPCIFNACLPAGCFRAILYHLKLLFCLQHSSITQSFLNIKETSITFLRTRQFQRAIRQLYLILATAFSWYK